VSATEVMVRLRRPPQRVFPEETNDDPDDANYLRFRLGPDKVVIALGCRSKVPGESFVGAPVELYLCDQDADEASAYERLLATRMKANRCFSRGRRREASRVVDPVLTHHEHVHMAAEDGAEADVRPAHEDFGTTPSRDCRELWSAATRKPSGWLLVSTRAIPTPLTEAGFRRPLSRVAFRRTPGSRWCCPSLSRSRRRSPGRIRDRARERRGPPRVELR
jgi:hypothetical protein